MLFLLRKLPWLFVALLLQAMASCATDTELNPQPLPPGENGGGKPGGGSSSGSSGSSGMSPSPDGGASDGGDGGDAADCGVHD
jgi:uncharacterized membrane protein YgcG